MLKHICHAFDLHRTTEEAFASNNGTFARYFTRDSTSGAITRIGGPSLNVPTATTNDLSDLVLKVPNFVIGSYTISLFFDCGTGATSALLHGYTDRDYYQLKEHLSNTFHISLLQHPLLLASHALQSYRQNAEAFRAKIDNCIYQTEMQLNYAVPGTFLHESTGSCTRRLDFDRFVRKLQSCHGDLMHNLHLCQTELISLTHIGNFGKECGAFLKNTVEELANSGIAALDRHADVLTVSERLVHDIEFQNNMWWALLSQISGLKERTQSHINLV